MLLTLHRFLFDILFPPMTAVFLDILRAHLALQIHYHSARHSTISRVVALLTLVTSSQSLHSAVVLLPADGHYVDQCVVLTRIPDLCALSTKYPETVRR